MANREFNSVNINVEFEETANRQQISSGDNIKLLFGKIRKWLESLKIVVFTGSYNDLSDKPVIPTVLTKTSELENDSGFITDSNSAVTSKAPLSSPILTGIPKAPTAETSAYNNQIATTEFVKNVISTIDCGTF